MVFDVSLEMQSDSKNYVDVQDDEITETCAYYKIGTCLTHCVTDTTICETAGYDLKWTKCLGVKT